MIQTLGPDTAVAPLIRQLQQRRTPVEVVPAAATKSQALAAFADVLDFPDWFGHNLDALFDCLLTWVHEHPDGALIWDGAAQLKDANPQDYQRICRVLSDLARQRSEASITIVERI